MHEIKGRRRNLPFVRAAAGWIVLLLSPLAVRPLVAQARPDVPDLSVVRSALKKYEDPYVAIHDGYFSTLGCLEIGRPGGAGEVPYKPGGMGVHFINVGLIGPVPDPGTPQVLLYEPAGDKLRLVGAEWFVPLSSGVKQRSTLWGQPFDGPMMGHPPLLPMELTHYDLHALALQTDSARNLRANYPDVKCMGHPYRVVEEAPKLVPEPKP